MLCNPSLLHNSSVLFILGLTCCLFLYVLSLSFSCSLICAHSALFTFSPLFSLCSLSLSFLHTMYAVVLPFYNSTHFSVRTTNNTQSLCMYFMHCVPCPIYAPFLFYAFQLMHSTSFYTSESLSTTPHLFFVLHSYSLCAPCACYIHNASACSTHVECSA